MTVDAVPSGWARRPLDELLEPDGLFDGPFGSNLKTDDYTEYGVRVIRLENIANLRFVAEKNTFVSEEKYNRLVRHTVSEGDIIVGSFVDGAVRVCVLPRLFTKAIAKADCFCVRTRRDATERRFIAFQLGTEATRDSLLQSIHGATRPRITTQQLRATKLLVAPLAEQRRIVEKVDELLARVHAARAHLTKVPAILRRFRQSVLAAACSGRLTEDWREEHAEIQSAAEMLDSLLADHETAGTGRRGNAAAPDEEAHDLDDAGFPPRWIVSELQYLCEPGRPITYGILKPGPDRSDGIPYIRVADFPKDEISLSNIRRTSPEIAHAYRRSILRSGDVLLSIRGTFGRVCRVPVELDGANLTQDTARLSIDRRLDPAFVALCLRSPSAQSRMRRAAKGVAVRGVNIGDVRALQVALPPREEQIEIVRRVNSYLKLCAAIERHFAAASTRADRLTQAILAKAFRGELAPTEAELARAEGRDYETAEELLERIAGAHRDGTVAIEPASRSRRRPPRTAQLRGGGKK